MAHTLKYNIINSNLDSEEVNCEIFELREIGLLPLSMDYFDSDWWKRCMDSKFLTLGNNPI